MDDVYKFVIDRMTRSRSSIMEFFASLAPSIVIVKTSIALNIDYAEMSLVAALLRIFLHRAVSAICERIAPVQSGLLDVAEGEMLGSHRAGITESDSRLSGDSDSVAFRTILIIARGSKLYSKPGYLQRAASQNNIKHKYVKC
jgi:hypothetical protein